MSKSITREIAEKIIRESVCTHGPGAECSEYHEEDIIDRIDAALRQREQEVRELCAKIAETKAAEWRKQAGGVLRTEKGRGAAVAMAIGADEIAKAIGSSMYAAAIRRDDTTREGEQSK